MELHEMFAIAAAGLVAGAVNTIVGSGSLISFPVMVFLGVPPVTANIANTVGLTPGSIVGAWAYRDKLRGLGLIALRASGASLAGAVVGAILLTQLPEDTFLFVVPILILAAAVLVGLQPRIMRHAGPR